MRFRLMVVAAGLAVALTGCTSGAQYAMNEYSGIEVKPFAVEGQDVYRVFDKPAANKLMITPSIGAAMGMGAAQGLTFGALNADNPKPLYEKAALGYLASTGRTCRILDGYLIEKPQWEFKYDCSPPPVAAAMPPKRR